MTSHLLPVPATIPSAALPISDNLKSAARAAQKFASMATAANTRRAYRSDWADFARWCARERLEVGGLDRVEVGPDGQGGFQLALGIEQQVDVGRRRP